VPYETAIRLLPPFGLLDTRVDASALPSIEAALGFGLPTEPNTVSQRGQMLALWLGPDEWLLRTSDGAELAWAARLREALIGLHGAVTPVTDAYAIFEIGGAEAREVLRQGTAIDLHPSVFGPGRCARTRFAKTRALLHHTGAESSYHVYVPRSYADYFLHWFERARGG